VLTLEQLAQQLVNVLTHRNVVLLLVELRHLTHQRFFVGQVECECGSHEEIVTIGFDRLGGSEGSAAVADVQNKLPVAAPTPPGPVASSMDLLQLLSRLVLDENRPCGFTSARLDRASQQQCGRSSIGSRMVGSGAFSCTRGNIFQILTTYEYIVLVTSLPYEVASISQLYRERADSENPFDELKNQSCVAGACTYLQQIPAADRFGPWILKEGMSIVDINASTVDRYKKWLLQAKPQRDLNPTTRR
jgi:hypothetical protein